MYQVIDMSFMLSPIIAILILMIAEGPLYLMKRYMRVSKEGTPPSGILSWYSKSYKAHSRSWNITRHLLYALGLSILGLWLQGIVGDAGILFCLFLMGFRFADLKTISEEAGISIEKEE